MRGSTFRRDADPGLPKRAFADRDVRIVACIFFFPPHAPLARSVGYAAAEDGNGRLRERKRAARADGERVSGREFSEGPTPGVCWSRKAKASRGQDTEDTE